PAGVHQPRGADLRHRHPGRRPMMETLPAPAETRDSGSRPRAPRVWPPIAILLAGTAVLTLIVLDGPAVVRAAAVVAYLAVVPGWAWARVIWPPDGLAQLVVGVALSLALGVLVAQAMVALGHWSPQLGLGALVAMASAAAALELARGVPAQGGSGQGS